MKQYNQGQISISNNTVTGINTQWLYRVDVGDVINAEGHTFTITNIVNNLEVEVENNSNVSLLNVDYVITMKDRASMFSSTDDHTPASYNTNNDVPIQFSDPGLTAATLVPYRSRDDQNMIDDAQDAMVSSKANTVDVYTKVQSDSKYSLLNHSHTEFVNFYTKAEIDTALNTKALSNHTHPAPDFSNYNTISEIDTKITNVSVDLTAYNTKVESDLLYSIIGHDHDVRYSLLNHSHPAPNLSNYNTIAEIDGNFATINHSHPDVDLSGYYTKSEENTLHGSINAEINIRALSSDVYTKVESDNKYSILAHSHAAPDLSAYSTTVQNNTLYAGVNHSHTAPDLTEYLHKTTTATQTTLGKIQVGAGTQDGDHGFTLATMNWVNNKDRGDYKSASDTYIPNKFTRDYFESKNGTVTNGSGFLKNNYNWSGGNRLQYSGADVASLGQPGCFVYTGPRYNCNVASEETIAVDPFAIYRCKMSAKGSDVGRCYGYISCIDIDGNGIPPYFTMRTNLPNQAGDLKLTLTQDVVDGDTVMHFDDLSGMVDDAGRAYQRRLLKSGYTNTKGDEYNFYSRLSNVYHTNWDSFADIDTVNNTITLNAPVDASTYYLRGVVGDQFWQGSSGGSYKYIFMGGLLMVAGGDWINSSALTTGMDSDGSWISSKFAEGTAFVKVGVLLGWGGSATVDATYKFTGFSMEKIVT